MWRKLSSIIMACGVLCLAGCTLFGGGTAASTSGGVIGSATGAVNQAMGSVGGVSFGILDVIAILAAIGAAGTIVAWGFGMPVPPKVTIALVATTVGAWVLKLILVKFIWIIVIMFLLALLLGGAAFAYTHRGWIERRLNRDLDKDGKIG